MKRSFFLGICLFLVCAFGVAEMRARYRIDLRDGSHVFSKDLPVQRGTILTFHQLPGGALTGLPEELVLRVQSSEGTVVSTRTTTRTTTTVIQPADTARKLEGGPTSRAQYLQPGDVLVLGPTGEGGASAPQMGDGEAGASIMGNAGNAANSAYGGNTNLNVSPTLGPNGLPVAPSSTDLSRAQAQGGTQTTSPNGFPATPGSATTIGPNGTPTLSPGVPGSNTPIGPNGTPTLAPPGTPGSAPPNIGPNGTPLAQPGAPGSTPPAIGPNGTPILAPPGAPGSAQPNVAPNGTPGAPAPSGSGNPGPGL